MSKEDLEELVDMDDADGGDDDLEIEIVDDRPPEDRVTPRKPDASGDDDWDSEEEIEGLSKKANDRIKRLRYEFHEQRRAAEAAAREREEAFKYAKAAHEQLKEQQDLLDRGEKVLLSEMKGKSDVSIQKAKADYKSAFEEGDPDKILEAQEALSKAFYEQEMYKSYKPMASPTPEARKRMDDGPPVPKQVDQKFESWKRANDWFDPTSNDSDKQDMTAIAMLEHTRLNNTGVTVGSDAYYEAIDKKMRRSFPDRFDGEDGAGEPVVTVRTKTPVTPVRRGTAVKGSKVQLTPSQVALARGLGLTPSQYARGVLKQQRAKNEQ